MYFEARTPLTDEQTLRTVVEPLATLQDVVRWAFALTPPQDIRGVIVQDEYSHDVVIGWRAPLYLAFDTT